MAAPPSSACSGTVQLALSFSPLSIGDGPESYSRNADCTWVVLASGPIVLRFSEFETAFAEDWVLVCDGASTSAPQLGRFSGVDLPGALTSTGSALTVRFAATSYHSRRGFTATLAMVGESLKLVGTVPTALGDLRCIGSITVMCVCSCRTAAVDRTLQQMRSLAGT